MNDRSRKNKVIKFNVAASRNIVGYSMRIGLEKHTHLCEIVLFCLYELFFTQKSVVPIILVEKHVRR